MKLVRGLIKDIPYILIAFVIIMLTWAALEYAYYRIFPLNVVTYYDFETGEEKTQNGTSDDPIELDILTPEITLGEPLEIGFLFTKHNEATVTSTYTAICDDDIEALEAYVTAFEPQERARVVVDLEGTEKLHPSDCTVRLVTSRQLNKVRTDEKHYFEGSFKVIPKE